MLKLIGYLIKLSLFSTLVLILGNSVHWQGKTISDQVKLRMSHAERTDLYTSMKGWAEKFSLDAKKGAVGKVKHLLMDEIAPSESQKLNALIRELNTQ